MSTKKTSVSFPLVNPHAAAIDVGSKFNMVCIGLEKEQIRSFGVFTEDHHQLAQWFQDHHIQTIAMESTGIYWKSLFLILQAYGFEVLLVNAAHIKNVRGKKSDVKDCQWIWQLHRAGLLQGSFQPDDFTESLRTYNRQRKNLIEGASQSVSRMQKALVLMNIQLPVVLSDITGKSGKAIIQAILNGQRNARQLAQLADPRVKASKSDIAKALTGHWHEQQLFTLRQHWEQYHFYQRQIAECDEQIETLLQEYAFNAQVARTQPLYLDWMLFTESGQVPWMQIAAASMAAPELFFTTGIAVAFPRSPMVSAAVAYELAANTGGRFRLGGVPDRIGARSRAAHGAAHYDRPSG